MILEDHEMKVLSRIWNRIGICAPRTALDSFKDNKKSTEVLPTHPILDANISILVYEKHYQHTKILRAKNSLRANLKRSDSA